MTEKPIPKTQIPTKQTRVKGEILSFGDQLYTSINLEAVHKQYNNATRWKDATKTCLIMPTTEIDAFMLDGITLEIHSGGFVRANGPRSLSELQEAILTARDHVLRDYILK